MNATELRTKAIALVKEITSSRLFIDQNYLSSEYLTEVYLSDHLDGLVVTLQNHTAAQILVDREIRYPRTWWDAFKLAYFPQSLLKLFPVQYHREALVARALYPDVALGDRPHFIVTRIEDRNWKEDT
jgi:hypothetical protein